MARATIAGKRLTALNGTGSSDMTPELLTCLGVALFALELRAFTQWTNELLQQSELETAFSLLRSFLGLSSSVQRWYRRSHPLDIGTPLLFSQLGGFGILLVRTNEAIALFGGMS